MKRQGDEYYATGDYRSALFAYKQGGLENTKEYKRHKVMYYYQRIYQHKYWLNWCITLVFLILTLTTLD